MSDKTDGKLVQKMKTIGSFFLSIGKFLLLVVAFLTVFCVANWLVAIVYNWLLGSFVGKLFLSMSTGGVPLEIAYHFAVCSILIPTVPKLANAISGRTPLKVLAVLIVLLHVVAIIINLIYGANILTNLAQITVGVFFFMAANE